MTREVIGKEADLHPQGSVGMVRVWTPVPHQDWRMQVCRLGEWAGWMLPHTTEPSGEAGTKGYYRGSSDSWKDKPLPL